MEDLNEIDNFYKKRLNNYSEEPTPHLWDKLVRNLELEEAKLYKNKIRKLSLIIISLFIICLVSFTGFYLQNNSLKSYKKLVGITTAKITSLTNKLNNINNNQTSIIIRSIHPPIQIVNNNKSSILYQQSNASLVTPFSVCKNHHNTNKINYQDTESIVTKYDLSQSNNIESYIYEATYLPLEDHYLIYNADDRIINPKINRKNGYFSIGVLGSIRHTIDKIIDNSPMNGINEEKEINSTEKNKNSLSLGVAASYNFNSRWSLESGVFYSKNIIDISHEYLYAYKIGTSKILYKLNTSAGYTFIKSKNQPPNAIGDSLYVSHGTNELEYIKIPIIINYSLNNGRFTYTPGLGVSFNFLTRMNLNTTLGSGLATEVLNIKKLKGGRKFYTGLVLNMNMNYRLNNKMSINLSPSYSLSMTPVTHNKLIKTFVENLAIGAGLSYKL